MKQVRGYQSNLKADVKRIRFDGKPYIIKDEPKHTLAEAKTTLRNLFKNYKIKIYRSEVSEEILKEAIYFHLYSGLKIECLELYLQISSLNNYYI